VIQDKFEEEQKSKLVSDDNECSQTADSFEQKSTEERKMSVTSSGMFSVEKGEHRSRSHSLYDTGDKTPSRSRASSLYEDKFVEKLGSFDSLKDNLGQAESIFEEKDEIQSSQESLHEFGKNISKTDCAKELPKQETKK